MKSTLWNTYYKKAECFKAWDSDESMFMTKDLQENCGMKGFLGVAIEDINDVVIVLGKENAHLYEALKPGMPVKPYFDLEMEYKGLTEKLIKSKINKFIEWLVKEINFVFGTDVVRDDLAILDSSRCEKLSYHVVIARKVYFASVEDHKLFIKYLVNVFNTPGPGEGRFINKFKYTKPNGKEGFIFDPIPYGMDQNVRFINQSKKGKPYVLKNITPQFNIRDTFIRLYEGIGGRTRLDIGVLTDAEIRRMFLIPKEDISSCNTEAIEKVYDIYAISQYTKPVTKFSGTFNRLVKMVSKDMIKGYHENVRSCDTVKVNIDIDGVNVDIKQIDLYIKQYMKEQFDIVVKSSYTQNY